MINKTTEDYLKQIFWLSRKSAKITTSAIAKSLAISSASVTDQIKKLFENGYLTYEPYYGVQLTKKGEKSARIAMNMAEAARYLRKSPSIKTACGHRRTAVLSGMAEWTP